MEKREKKKGRVYWRFLIIWCVLLTLVLTAALIRFYVFLKDYQKVFEETRPLLHQRELMQLFDAGDAEQIVDLAQPVELGPYEGREQFVEFLNAYLAGKTMDFGTKAGEHIEERPVYVVTADGEPFAVVRLKKKKETAAYGLPLWETDSVELLPMETKEYHLLAPSTVTVTVNGIPVTSVAIEESGIEGGAEKYLEKYTQIPTFNRYDLGCLHGEPMISCVNAYGEPVPVSYKEDECCYEAGFGGNRKLQEAVGDYAVQVVTDYAMYVSNDAGYSSLDQYFPKGSELLKGIKENQRKWFDDHLTPEIKNQKVTEFIAYSDDAFSAQVYLEQYMYVPYSEKTEKLVTESHFYFVKIDGEWKVSGIIF